MPYVSQARRDKFPIIPVATSAPEVAYLLGAVVATYFKDATVNHDCQSIAALNQSILGAFDVAKAEFVNSIVAPYEAGRKSVNGDVYGTVDSPCPTFSGTLTDEGQEYDF